MELAQCSQWTAGTLYVTSFTMLLPPGRVQLYHAGVSAEHANRLRKVQQDVHDRATDLLGDAAADRVPEERVAGEAHRLTDEEGDSVVRVAGGRQGTDREIAGLHRARCHDEAETGH